MLLRGSDGSWSQGAWGRPKGSNHMASVNLKSVWLLRRTSEDPDIEEYLAECSSHLMSQQINLAEQFLL